MGYNTEFQGEFKLDKPLDKKHEAYLRAFADTRHMRRLEKITETMPDSVRLAVGLPIGVEAEYFVAASGGRAVATVVDHNQPPSTQPGLFCQWIPGYDDPVTTIEYDGNEKFYNYIDWIEYLINHFIGPWGYKLNGKVRWRGEEFDDVGSIVIKDNVVSIEKF